MRLFHVSEEAEITKFEPRIPTRNDLDSTVGLVWAIDENHLPNFLTPRNCPRVAYSLCAKTTQADIQRFFTCPTMRHVLIVEYKWLDAIRKTTLFLYEFDSEEFTLQDQTAGYYVARKTQYPKAKWEIQDLLSELCRRNVELRFVDNLWPIAKAIKNSTLHWSLCRMAFAQPETQP